MSRIIWGAIGERFYEAGVDRGVLYAPSQPGVAWNGLTSIEENPDGGSPRPYYFDGMKFLNLASSEEYAATIRAYSAPKEFAVCEGVAQIQAGLFAAQQPKKSFGFCYRTTVGVLGEPDYGYKIHIVYNALAAPAPRPNKTLDSDATPLELSWSITTQAPAITGYRRTAHMVVDSRLTSPTTLAAVEDLLYGTVSTTPSLPTPDALIALYSA